VRIVVEVTVPDRLAPAGRFIRAASYRVSPLRFGGVQFLNPIPFRVGAESRRIADQKAVARAAAVELCEMRRLVFLAIFSIFHEV
jgi:hypothetical protein